jgi:hypothetical protein
MKNLIKAAFAVFIFLTLVSVQAQNNDGLNGVWFMNNDINHTVHFLNDGTFKEVSGDTKYTGTWTLDANGILTLRYSDMTPEMVKTYETISFRDNDMVWTFSGVETTWTRGKGNTDEKRKDK